MGWNIRGSLVGVITIILYIAIVIHTYTMIRILSLTVYNAENSTKLYHETYRDMGFESESVLKKWTMYSEKWWTAVMGYSVRVYVIRRRRPQRSNLKKLYPVLEATAKVMGVGITDVISTSRKRLYVDVRKMACMILIDADYTPREIEKHLPFKHRIVYVYREKMEDRLALEPGFEEQYKAIKKQVMELSFGTDKKEDEKPKEEEE